MTAVIDAVDSNCSFCADAQLATSRDVSYRPTLTGNTRTCRPACRWSRSRMIILNWFERTVMINVYPSCRVVELQSQTRGHARKISVDFIAAVLWFKCTTSILRTIQQRIHYRLGYVLRHDGMLLAVLEGRTRGKRQRGCRRIYRWLTALWESSHHGVKTKRKVEDRRQWIWEAPSRLSVTQTCFTADH